MQRNSQIPCRKKQASQAKAVLEQLKNYPFLMGQGDDFSQLMSSDVTETFCQRNFSAENAETFVGCSMFISLTIEDFETCNLKKIVEGILVQHQ